MLKRFYIALLTLSLCGAGSLHAQTQAAPEGGEASAIETQAEQLIQEAKLERPQLATSSQTTQPAPVGVCTVITGVLAEYCQNNPGDISCNFQ